MKHAVILAHPKPTSFCAAIARTCVEHLRATNHHVLLRDLYAEDFDPRLKAEELPTQAGGGWVGLSLGGLTAAYAGRDLSLAFASVSAGFAGLAVLGATIRADLSGLGAFYLMGGVALIVAMLANMLFGATALDLAIWILGVVVFAGLMAFDDQRPGQVYDQTRSAGCEGDAQMSFLGAPTLYLDLLNLFLFTVRLTGRRR